MLLSSLQAFRAAPAAGLLAWMLLGSAGAQDSTVRLDVPYVPTSPDVVARMLQLGEVDKNDFVIDLGSGDGRIAIAAAKTGARALGIDIDPQRIKEARDNAAEAGVSDRVTFRQQNLFDAKIDEATVVTMYLLNKVNMQLRPRLLAELKPGTRLVSHMFSMDDWRPDRTAVVDSRNVYMWIVPAKVEGRWRVEAEGQSFTLDITQRFQEIKGTATIGARSVPLGEAHLEGDMIRFSVDTGRGEPALFIGTVKGQTIEPRSGRDGRADTNWRATRAS